MILAKKGKYAKNFVAIDLKKNWQEKVNFFKLIQKLVKPPNMRKFKLKKEKYYNNLKKNMINMRDEKYLGKGRSGLDEVENKDAEENLLGIAGNDYKDDTQIKVPFFSKGYYDNEENNLNIQLEKEKNGVNDASVINEEFDKKDEISNVNEIIIPKINLSATPGKSFLATRLSTVVKSSIRKQITLGTELRKLSKEFRYLLSGKKFFLEEEIEKKLSFNDNNEMNIINEENNSSTQSVDESLSKEEVDVLETDILKKVLNENFNQEDFRSGQLETIKNILNGKVN